MEDLIRAGHLVIKLPARALGLLILCRHLDVVTYLEVDPTAVSVYVPLCLFLGLLHGRISRFLGLVHAFYHGLGFLSI